MSQYVFDQAWARERERLGGLESLYDTSTTRYLADLGVSEGWHCLEVGCGAGSVALWLADRVGSSGQVVATDLDIRFMEGHGRPNLDVRQHDMCGGHRRRRPSTWSMLVPWSSTSRITAWP